MQLEAIKSKNTTEVTLDTGVLDMENTEKNEAEAEKAVDRLRIELDIDIQKEREVKRQKEIENVRQELGIEKEENKEIFREADVLFKKLTIPFSDGIVDKKRKELLKETQEIINPNLKSLEEKKIRSLDIEKEREELLEKTRNLEIQKVEKEKEMQTLKNEAQEYIYKTKPPIIRTSTKEKLARAKEIIKSTSKEIKEIINLIDDIRIETSSINSLSAKKDLELIEINRISRLKITDIEFSIKEKSSKLELLKNEQEKVDKNKEMENFTDEALKMLSQETTETDLEINPLIKEKQRLANENSNRNIKKIIFDFFNDSSFEKLPKEEVLKALKLEVEKVRESAAITINIGKDSLSKTLNTGRFISTFDVPIEDNKRSQSYLYDRKMTEESMGVYSKGTEADPYTIVGAMASDNGYQEIYGGASFYGEISVKLKPEVLDRCVYYNGDSMGTNAGQARSKKEDALDFLYNKEDSVILKAIRNIKDKEYFSSAGKEFMPGEGLNDYLEAEILGGVRIEDIESINIPLLSAKRKLEETKLAYPSDKKIKHWQKINNDESKSGEEIKQFLIIQCQYDYQKIQDSIVEIRKKFPQYASLIKEV